MGLLPQTRDVRSAAVLKAAVEAYIASGVPVGSRTLNRTKLAISPAAIRAVMAELERSGLLVKPHTSAGRIPTPAGYRRYVNELMAPAEVLPGQEAQLPPAVGSEPDMGRWVRAVASLTGLTCFGLSTSSQQRRHRHVELVRLRRRELVAIFTTCSGEVHHRVVRLDEDIPQADLERCQNYLNRRFDGLTLREIRTLIVDELERLRSQYRTLAARAMSLGQQALPQTDGAELRIVVSGQHHLMSWPELASSEVAAALLLELEQRETWVTLLDAVLHQSSMTVLIGPENDVEGLQDCAVVATSIPWSIGGQGGLGLVGPTRIGYANAIAMLQVARARLWGEPRPSEIS